jgi:hypothetical protein
LEGLVGTKAVTWNCVSWEYGDVDASNRMRTDIQYQSFSGSLWRIDTKWPHASDDWTDEVNVEDGEEVDNVEDDGQGKEAHAPETRHGWIE